MKVLYAEDEKALSTAVTEILKIEGIDVDNAYDGQEALELVNNNYYDVCVFDIMMPKIQGTEVLTRMRAASNFTPVLLLTAKTTTEDRVEGLSIGADDYLCKPFEMPELIARIKSMARRSSNEYQKKILKYSNLVLDCQNNELKSDNGSLMLSAKESALLALFMQQPDTELKGADVSAKVLGQGEPEAALKLYILYVQNKMEQINARAKIIVENDVLFLRQISE